MIIAYILRWKKVDHQNDKLELLKSFVNNGIVPKCRLKDVCNKLEIMIELTSINKDLTSRTENMVTLYTVKIYTILD